MIEALTDAFCDAMRSALDGDQSTLPPLTGPDLPGARTALAELTDRAAAVSAAGDPVSWAQAMDHWHAKLQDVAGKAFGGNPADAEDAALIRFLELDSPRTAAFLSLVGVVVHQPGQPDRLNRLKFQQLLQDPGTLVNEPFWDALLGDAGLPGTGRLPAVLMGLLLLAPQTVLALARDQLKVTPLPAPVADAPGPWRDYRAATEGWISVTVPLGDPAQPTPYPADIYDYTADILPDLTGTLAIRSQRLPKPGGGARTVFEMWLAVAIEGDVWQYDLGSDWYVRVEPGVDAGFGYDGQWHGAFRQFVLDPSKQPGPGDPVVVSLGRDLGLGRPDISFGPPYDTRLIVQDLGLYLKLREDHPIFEIGGFVHGFSAVLTNRWFRTFGISDTVFRDGLRFALELDIAYIESLGVRLNLSSGLDVTFGIDKEFGKKLPVSFTLHSIRLHVPIEATQDDFNVRAEVRFHISVRLGPVILVADGLGGWVGYWTVDGSRSYVGFLPPTGAGLQITAGPFTGGGYLDFTGGPNERYGGVVYVRVGSFEITAFGLHELTGKPGDSNRSTSLVMVLGVRFAPGIQLGFFLEISGFGGLVGINRRADTDALRERLTSGAAGNVLFAEDPIRNAPRILADLGALFPAHAGTHVFGPTVQLSWLNIAGFKIFTLDLGLFFEFPGPSRIILLGSARAQVPPVKGIPHLLDIRFDIVGFVDFPQRIIEFDATLINSMVMQVLNLTGDLALRIAWGDHPYLLLSFGGFHPNFKPLPAQFPEMTRLALTVKPGFLSLGVFFRAEAYFALTSNTVQFGGRVELGYAAGPVNLVGFLALDALFQFSPFHFEVSISAGVRLRWNSTTLAGVRLEGTITGPGPVTLTGKACFEILWFDICADATITLGGSSEPAPPAVSSVAQALGPDLSDPANLSPEGGTDPHVVQKPRPSVPGDNPLVSPLGSLCWAQKRVPLNLLLDRFEGSPLAERQRVELTVSSGGGSAQDWFAPGTFANLSQSEALNRPGFEKLDAGARISMGASTSSTAVRHDVTVIEIRLPSRDQFVSEALPMAAVVLAGIRARTGAAQAKTTTPYLTVVEEQFAVRDANGAVVAGGLSVSEAHQQARVRKQTALHVNDLVDLGVI